MDTTSKIRFGIFTTAKGERRIYVNGTTRDKIYFTGGAGYEQSRVLPGFYKNSDALRPQTNTSSVFTRREKDRAAFAEATKVLVAEFGETITFDELWERLS